MVSGLMRVGVLVALACVVICASGAAAVAKGPDQAVVTGPGLDQPILVRTHGALTTGPDLASLIESSGIFDQLWCKTCDGGPAEPPTVNVGPMYLVRYRLPSVIGRRPGWVEQRTYPFAEPHPV